jgi:magnesium-transporting ATPase (P-type)
MAAAICITVLTIFHLNIDKGLPVAQSLAFLSLIVMQWTNAISSNFEYKSWVYSFVRPNKKLLIAIAGSAIMQIIVFTTSFGQYLNVVSLEYKDVAVALIVPIVVAFISTDLHKWITNRFAPKGHHA